MQTFPFFSYSILFEFLAVSLPWAKIDLVSLKLETEHVRCINWGLQIRIDIFAT